MTDDYKEGMPTDETAKSAEPSKGENEALQEGAASVQNDALPIENVEENEFDSKETVQQATEPNNSAVFSAEEAGQTANPVVRAVKPLKRNRPLKEKLPLRTKIFLWVISALGVGATVSFGVVLAMHIAPFSLQELKNAIQGYSQGQPFNTPDSSERPDSNQLEDEQNTKKAEIDVEPNKDGIAISKTPVTEELSAEEVYQKVVHSTVTVKASLYVEQYGQSTGPSTGTGIIATSDGYIITNSHVVLNSKNADVTVITSDGEEYDAVVVGVDKTTDLGIIKTNDHNFTPAEFGDADELNIGEWVLAIGNPGGERFSSSLTRGIISGLNRSVGQYSENGMKYIQTDAAINPGNSGGPLVNLYGQVVGINSSKIASTQYEGMGFAIPVTNAKQIIDELLSGGYVKGRTRLGIRGTDVASEAVVFQGIPQGFIIGSLDEDSVFNDTDVKVGDIIVAIDDEEVTGVSSIGNILLGHKPGDEIKVTLYRPNTAATVDGTTFEVTVTLVEDTGETQG